MTDDIDNDSGDDAAISLSDIKADLIGEIRAMFRTLKAEYEIGKAAEAAVDKYRERIVSPENSAYLREYATNAVGYQKAGITLEDYLASRRIDDGLDTLVAGKETPAYELASLADGQTTTTKYDAENEKYKAEYAANAAEFVKRGITVAEYIASRRIDDGLDTLTPYKK